MAVAKNDSGFVMHGARAAVADGMLHIEEQVKALEMAVAENTGLAFDLAKTLVESACKTIITERGSAISIRMTTFQSCSKRRSSLSHFSLLRWQATQVQEGASTKRSAVSSTALQGVCELRNACGFASHGSDGPRPFMEGIQALLVAQAADAIIGFLYRVHRQDHTRPKSIMLEYRSNPDFNEWLDEQCEPVRILALPPYRPSDVLFNVDQEAYRDLLNDYGAEDESEAPPGEANNEGEEAQ